jgi:uncharacterized protein (DUF2141 family)
LSKIRSVCRAAAVAALVCVPAWNLAAANTLSVRIQGLRSDAGQVLIAVCTAETFQEGQCREERRLRTNDARTAIEFQGLPTGAYAVKIVHDENGNGRLDTDWLGIPIEGYGLSNNPPKDRRPSFDASSFRIGSDPVAVDISLFYR